MHILRISKNPLRSFVVSLVLAAASSSMAAGSSAAKTIEGTWAPIKAELSGQSFPEVVSKTIKQRPSDFKTTGGTQFHLVIYHCVNK